MATLYKRGKTWHARAQRNNVEFRSSMRTASRVKAEKRFKEWIGQLENQQWGERSRPAFAEAMNLFLEQHSPTLKDSSALRYAGSAKHLLRAFANHYLDEITRKEWRDYVASRKESGVTGAGINRDRACLSKIFAVAIEAELTDLNPVPTFMREREPPGRIRFLTKEEHARLLDAADPPMRALILVAINTGMRLGELLSLHWSQIDPEAGEILIPKTKTDEPRAIPLPKIAAAQLPAQTGTPSGAVFQGLIGRTKYPVPAMSNRFATIVRRAKIKNMRFHDLRHTFASWAVKGWHEWQDRPMRRDRLQLWLGHKSPAMTNRYAHLETEDLHSEMKR